MLSISRLAIRTADIPRKGANKISTMATDDNVSSEATASKYSFARKPAGMRRTLDMARVRKVFLLLASGPGNADDIR